MLGLKTVSKYELRGLCCEHCAAKIKDQVKDIQGVKSADLAMSDSILKVRFDKNKTKNLDTRISSIVNEHDNEINVIKVS